MEITKRKERVGTKGFNTLGSLMEVTEYNRYADIWVKFLDFGNLVHTDWNSFCKGNVRNPYDKSVYGIGYLGEGNYKTRTNKKETKMYKTWSGMFERCYSEKYQESHQYYVGCTVAKEWHCFQNFAKWYDDNYYEVEEERMELDKDILVKRNRVYSPDACVFVPKDINTLFTKSDAARGDLPLGVDWNKSSYRSRCLNGKGKSKHLGYFNTAEEAFVAYKKYKEKVIRQIAEEYKDRIPDKLYEALLKYEVEIND